MKNILKSTILLLCGTFVMASCSDDRENNPVLLSPTTFTMNVPTYSTQTIDLATSSALDFTWSQPAYGYPAAAEYQVQFSPDNSWTVSTDEANADKSGTLKADYANVGLATSTCNASVEAVDIDKAIQQIKQYKEDEVPANLKVYARAYAVYAGDTIYSNAVSFNVAPYYVELQDAAPELWYLIGSCIGDGSWKADQVIPMYTIAGNEYDSKTGQGVISWTGYLTTDGFKLVKTPGAWNDQIGSSDGGVDLVKNNGGSSNICVPTNGIYTITIDTKALAGIAAEASCNNAIKIEAYTGTPKVFTSMAIPSSENNWNQVTGNVMSPLNSSVENHDWTTTVTYNADAASSDGCKFAANGTWDSSWGSSSFPYGTGTNGGSNIPFKAGTYKVYLNDITGQYMFIKQ